MIRQIRRILVICKGQFVNSVPLASGCSLTAERDKDCPSATRASHLRALRQAQGCRIGMKHSRQGMGHFYVTFNF